MHDIVIRHGEVADGTGAAPVRADVAIDGDRITEVGAVSGPVRARPRPGPSPRPRGQDGDRFA